MVRALPVQFDGALAELAINATSSGPNVTGKARARTALVSCSCQIVRIVLTNLEFGLGCEYIRERKKRGKASRKDLAQQAAAAAANGQKSPNGRSSEGSSAESRNERDASTTSLANEIGDFGGPQASKSLSLNGADIDLSNPAREAVKGRLRAGSLESLTEMSNVHQPHMSSRPEPDQIGSPAALNMNGYSTMHGYRPALNTHLMNGNGQSSFNAGQGHISGVNYVDLPYAIQSQSPQHYPINTPGAFRLADHPLPGFPMGPDSPGGWMSLPSPSNQYQQNLTHLNFNSHLRYPVLEPLLPHLGNIIPTTLACDMLELYFASSSSALLHPTSPYVLGYVFRKHSILHPTKPRQCTLALLASILWVVAQTSDAAFLTALPSSRGRVCQKLLELTVGLLKPLIHSASSSEPTPNFSNSVINGVALGGLGVAMPGSVNTEGLNGETGAFGAAGTLDDVVTYIHLATVVSASEYKGASLRWWNAAWSLARELKLGRELPQNPPIPQPSEVVNDTDADGEADDTVPRTSGIVSEEEREERRRIWWLVYTVDRHLALCYNRPLFLLDIECDGLLQPMDDTLWQAGEYYTGDSSIHITSPSGTPRIRRRGPNFECTGHSIFGYFLPLMTILGEIVDLYHAKNHPRFGIGFRSAQEWDDHASEIARQLDAYGQSLRDFEARHLNNLAEEQVDKNMEGIPASTSNIEHNDMGTPSVHSGHTASSHHNLEADIQTRTVVAYGTHVMHVLHILLAGKWDPISLLDDNDLWISSQSFITATGHAVSAAEAINSILEYDPGLEFMPFFFGVYLLQGSFLLLLIADKLQASCQPRSP